MEVSCGKTNQGLSEDPEPLSLDCFLILLSVPFLYGNQDLFPENPCSDCLISCMISAVIIANNEEKNIGRCLESLLDVVTEIIVVDSGSTDGTREICESYGVIWIDQPWLGYGAQKNVGNRHASHPYILSMDADEALSPELRTSIIEVSSRPNGAFSMNRRTNYCGKWIRHCGWYPDRKIRLFPKQAANWDLAEVHERLVIQTDCGITHLSGDLLHYSYYSEREHRERQEYYVGLQAKALLGSNKKPGFWEFWIKPAYTFFRIFFIRSGWLDGLAGWKIASITAWGTRRRYEILADLRAQKNRGEAPA